MRRPRFAMLAVLALALGLGACARGVDFNPDPGTTHAINVVNTFGEPMIVSYEDGTGTRLLGTVAAARSERFVVATAAGTVSIVARNEADTRTVRRTVVLRAGETVEVRLN